MNCQRFQESFGEAHDGLLSPEADAALRAHLAACPACRREWERVGRTLSTLARLPEPEPGPHVREAFQAALADAIREEETRKAAAGNPAAGRPSRRQPPFASLWDAANRLLGAVIPTQPALQAACALLLLLAGLAAGSRFPAASADASTRAELASLREQVGSMSQLVAYSLAQQQEQPVGTRLQNVSLTRRSAAGSPSAATLSVLVNSLAFDPSTNVRLAALEALYEHADAPLARRAVLTALPRERSPLVQLAMIDFIAATGDTAAAAALESLGRDASADAEVRAAAGRVLTRL